MNRSENLAMWKRIAAGELSGREQWDAIDTWDWIRGVAEMIIQADDEPTPNSRNAAIVAAVGLKGKLDTYAALRDLTEKLTIFSPIDDDGNDIRLSLKRTPKVVNSLPALGRAQTPVSHWMGVKFTATTIL